MIALIEYGTGDEQTVARALEDLNIEFRKTSNEYDICRSTKVIFPGSGKILTGLKQLHLLNLFSVLRIIKKPVLGIGLGMHLMADYSAEGNVACLGIFPGTVIRLEDYNPEAPKERWKKVDFTSECVLFNGIKNGEQFLFSNSYYLPKNQYSTSLVKNSITFSASFKKENAYAVQFHPEKSGEAGLKVLQNFIDI